MLGVYGKFAVGESLGSWEFGVLLQCVKTRLWGVSCIFFLVVLDFKVVFKGIHLRSVFCFIMEWFTIEISFLS